MTNSNHLLKLIIAKNKGFTLIELLVVVIIIGVLAAVALPNLLSQVGKARETEAKNGIGTINRAQQAYHFEKQVFAADGTVAPPGPELGIVVESEYYDFTVWSSNPPGFADVSATPTDGVNDGVRAFAGEIVYANGNYDVVVCVSDAINGPIANTPGGVGVAPTVVSGIPDATCSTGTELN